MLAFLFPGDTLREHYPGESVPAGRVAVDDENVTIIVLFWEGHLGAEEVFVGDLF